VAKRARQTINTIESGTESIIFTPTTYAMITQHNTTSPPPNCYTRTVHPQMIGTAHGGEQMTWPTARSACRHLILKSSLVVNLSAQRCYTCVLSREFLLLVLSSPSD